MQNILLKIIWHILVLQQKKELEEMREKQETAKIRPGYYGVWAKYRNLPIEEAAQKIKSWRTIYNSF